MPIVVEHDPGFDAGLVALATMTIIALDQAGIIPMTPALIAALSAILLVVGMPHGSFDLALLHRAAGDGARSVVALVALYLAIAAAMYAIWQIAPVVALAIFLVMAVAHFADDWRNCGEGFLAVGLAAGIVAAPAITHGDALSSLFIALTGNPDAAMLTDLLLLMAPVAIGVAVVAILRLWVGGRRSQALCAACGLAALLMLPPVAGFALFFCLVHSPLQFRSHAAALGLHGFVQWRGIVVPLSLGGLAIAVAIFLASGIASVSTNIFASSFMALSILTAPHMLVPMVLARRVPRRRALWVAV